MATDAPETDESLPIGQRLRAGRERVNLSEAQVAQALNLDHSVVAALEAGDFDSLGAPIFVKGHLRNYARLVKMDPAEIVAAYEVLERSAPPELPARAPRGVRMDESSGWGSRIAWVVLVLIVAAIGYWLYRNGQLSSLVHTAQKPQPGAAAQALPATRGAPSQTKIKPLPPQPRTSTPAAGAPLGSTLPQNQTVASARMTGGKARSGKPKRGTAKTAEAPAKTAASEAAATPTAQTTGGLERAEAHGGLPIALSLTGDSWVEVDDASGKRLYYGLAREGQTLPITGRPPLHVFLGNAANVRVLAAGNVISTTDYTHSDGTARFTIRKIGDNPAFADDPTEP